MGPQVKSIVTQFAVSNLRAFIALGCASLCIKDCKARSNHAIAHGRLIYSTFLRAGCFNIVTLFSLFVLC